MDQVKAPLSFLKKQRNKNAVVFSTIRCLDLFTSPAFETLLKVEFVREATVKIDEERRMFQREIKKWVVQETFSY